jgi:hypothetical protein
MFQNREKNSVKQCYFILWGTGTRRDRLRAWCSAQPVGPLPYRVVPHTEPARVWWTERSVGIPVCDAGGPVVGATRSFSTRRALHHLAPLGIRRRPTAHAMSHTTTPAALMRTKRVHHEAPSYKSQPSPPFARDWTIVPPLLPPRWTPCSSHFHSHPKQWTSSLGLPRAATSASWLAPPSSSPKFEQSLPRRRRRCSPESSPTPNPPPIGPWCPLLKPRAIYLPATGPHRRQRAPLRLRGHICEKFWPEGMVVKVQRFLRA